MNKQMRVMLILLVVLSAAIVSARPAASLGTSPIPSAVAVNKVDSIAFGINNFGISVGYSRVESGDVHAVLWTPKEGIVDLEGLDGDYSHAYATNNIGQVVGYRRLETGEEHATLWNINGARIDLGTLGGSSSHAYGINNRGESVGASELLTELPLIGDVPSHAVRWNIDGSIVDLGTLGGASSLAYDINDRGEAVGYSETADGATHAAFWPELQIMIDLGHAGRRKQLCPRQ